MVVKHKIAKINEFGDVVCPTCGMNIIIPEGMELRTGTGKCNACGKNFRVVMETANNSEDDCTGDNFPTIN